MYLTEDDYMNMGGSSDSLASYELYEFEARTKIDYWTFNRLQKEEYEDLPEAVKFCMVKLIKSATIRDKLTTAIPTETSTEGAGIARQSNDGVSVSYNSLSASEVYRNSMSDDKAVIMRYLSGIRNSLGQELLYRGVYPNER